MKALCFVLGLCLFATPVFAQGAKDKAVGPADKGGEASVSKQDIKAPDPKKTPAKPKKAKDMTLQELVDGITEALDEGDELMNYVPGFKQEKGPEGKGYYTYKGARLEKVEKEKLAGLYNRLRQESTRLNAERITMQLEMIRQTQQAANIANQAARIPVVRVPPTPTPPPPPQPPKAPPPPPPIPRR